MSKKPSDEENELAQLAVRESWDIDPKAVDSVVCVGDDRYHVKVAGQTYELAGDEVKALGLQLPAPGAAGEPRGQTRGPVVEYDPHAEDATTAPAT